MLSWVLSLLVLCGQALSGMSVSGAVVGFLLIIVALISRGGMGMGDVKFMAMIAIFLCLKGAF